MAFLTACRGDASKEDAKDKAFEKQQEMLAERRAQAAARQAAMEASTQDFTHDRTKYYPVVHVKQIYSVLNFSPQASIMTSCSCVYSSGTRVQVPAVDGQGAGGETGTTQASA